jgi:hypothetical protein
MLLSITGSTSYSFWDPVTIDNIDQQVQKMVDDIHGPPPKVLDINNDEPQVCARATWPSYTDLVLGHSGDYNLTAQTHEVRAVVRKALPFLLGKLSFVDFYPASTTRAAWHRVVLIAAASKLKKKGSQAAAVRFASVQDRLRDDENYCPILGKLVRQHNREPCLLTTDYNSSMRESLLSGTILNLTLSKLSSLTSTYVPAALRRWSGT